VWGISAMEVENRGMLAWRAARRAVSRCLIGVGRSDGVRRRKHRVAMAHAIPLLLLAVSVSGCVAWVDPYVSPDKAAAASPTFEQAIDYANDMKEVYRASAGDYAKLKNVLGVGLIPLGASALGLGITGGSSNVITGLALGGAAAYGTGTFLYSKPT